ncbi:MULTISPECIES: WD40/YVTN/BNR-like repeat-containing protein [Bacillus]|uniref:Uncharacterized protein n=1 Tax=Bacillus velezensis TaxID=492670 RepID=A0A411A5E3_BACVE|nr:MULTISPECIES: sialidase family protein [Bacillus]AIU81543.1 BNR/Asp-box repeat [Bacillus velezensis]APA02469.1 hypothetical protein BK055_07965 [Bacillus velezensis]ASB52869.1 uncharacterized protein S100072_01533 [Bacillus velezensis]ASB65113.1 uncharacterized protein S101413_01666 [Bacillus velezensis]ASK58184.1 exo-alpha-sialidase [Bacillus velezensis]
MFHKGATAVMASVTSGYFVAVKDEGIFHFSAEEGWKRLFRVKSRIHVLTYIGPYIFAAGEKGAVLRSADQGKTWTASRFPTSASVWAVAGRNDGFVCAHGTYCLYLSDDFGVTWHVAKPFSQLKEPPVIRSLCLHGQTIYIGTRIHMNHGGIWAYDLTEDRIRRISRERQRMTASMMMYQNDWLIAAKGAAKGERGEVAVRNVRTQEEFAITAGPAVREKSFLDVSEDNGIIYVTSSQDENGFSRIYQADLAAGELKWFDTIRGHGWRVANREENFFCAGLYESKFVRPYEAVRLAH